MPALRARKGPGNLTTQAPAVPLVGAGLLLSEHLAQRGAGRVRLGARYARAGRRQQLIACPGVASFAMATTEQIVDSIEQRIRELRGEIDALAAG